MASTNRSESRMLERYLHEQGAVVQGSSTKNKTGRQAQGTADQVAHNKEKQAVKYLDKEMEAATDHAMLEEALKAQQGMLVESAI